MMHHGQVNMGGGSGAEEGLGSNMNHEEAILNKEQELMRKAKDLEREMQSVKQAKIDVVVKQFEQ